MRTLVAIALCMAMAGAFAADSYVTLSGVAYHFDKGHNYNWLTAGAGLELGVRENVRLAGGFYLNSNRNWSTYGAVVYLPFARPLLEGTIRAGVIGALVTGYGRPITPAPGAALAYEMRGYGLNLIGVPSADGSPAVLWIQLKSRW